MYKSQSKSKRSIIPRLTVGDRIRITLTNRLYKFKKEFKQQNIREIFTVTRIDRRQHIPLYFLNDLNGEEIDGGFYKQELTPTQLPESLNIEKVLGHHILSGKLQYNVRYAGHDQSFDQWIDAGSILHL